MKLLVCVTCLLAWRRENSLTEFLSMYAVNQNNQIILFQVIRACDNVIHTTIQNRIVGQLIHFLPQ